MDWATAAACGAAGGAVVEAVVIFGRITLWQTERQKAGERGRKRPRLKKFVDVPAHSLALLTRVLMGAGAGWLFHTQVTGVYAAVAAGAAAPALLRQLGAAKNLNHDASADASATELTPADNLDPEQAGPGPRTTAPLPGATRQNPRVPRSRVDLREESVE